ncbi:hypothetical protein [Microbacterium sp. A84]|uniref:hypothetical protein n=1 Tax=Microbacterium sp. A84 TaxID=3450715 RepID=UPI003F42D6F6
MATDPIDALLDTSAPARHDITTTDIRGMIMDARADVPAAPKRTRRTAVLSGVLTLLLVGGAGVATASSDWVWGEGLANPERSYTYTAPMWGHCELRFSGIDTHNVFNQAQVNQIVDDWFATADVEAEAAPFVDEYRAFLEEIYKRDQVTDPRAADLIEWGAHEQALRMALHNELVANGYDSGNGDLQGADSHSQLHCEGEDWSGEGSEQ